MAFINSLRKGIVSKGTVKEAKCKKESKWSQWGEGNQGVQ